MERYYLPESLADEVPVAIESERRGVVLTTDATTGELRGAARKLLRRALQEANPDLALSSLALLEMESERSGG